MKLFLCKIFFKSLSYLNKEQKSNQQLLKKIRQRLRKKNVLVKINPITLFTLKNICDE